MGFEWIHFIQFISLQKDISPILYSVLKSTKYLHSVNDKVHSVECPNIGAKLFLESKMQEIEKYLDAYGGQKLSLVFTIREKKNKQNITLPLIDYQDSFDQIILKSGLQKRFTFENYAVSDSNHIAHAAALTVAENPGNHYNPLFIYGGVGVGKTHLLQAIGLKILEDDKSAQVLYCTSEEFTNDLIENIRKKNTSYFRNKYRNLTTLLIDDVQFIAGKNYVQEEFYHTFNTIIKNGGQIVFTSDKPPKEINKLEERLKSRFLGGLIIDIQIPDFELRTAIILIKAKQRNITIDFDAAKYIAEKNTDTRALEGALLQIYSKMIVQNPNPTISKDSIHNNTASVAENIKRINPSDIIKTVSLHYGVKPAHIKSSSRKEAYVKPRQIIMYLLRSHLSLKLEDIAHILKRKDHTTIIHGIDKIKKQIIKDISLKEDINSIINSFS